MSTSPQYPTGEAPVTDALIKRLIVEPLGKCRGSWDRIDGTARVFFIAALNLVECVSLFDWPPNSGENPKPTVEKLYELLDYQGGTIRKIDTLPVLMQAFYLNSAQQRIASALDRCVNWALMNTDKFFEEEKWGTTNSPLYHQCPGLRLWVLATKKDKELKTFLYLAAQAFWAFPDVSVADAWVRKLDEEVRHINKFETDPVLTIREQIAQEIKSAEGATDIVPDYKCLAFVDARVNAHKHYPTSQSPETRPFVVECVTTLIAFNALADLIYEIKKSVTARA